MDTALFLRKVSLFKSLSYEAIDALAELTISRSVDRDSMIIMAGGEGDSLFIIRKGQVKVTVVGEDGREAILALLGAGAVFGELSLLDVKPRSANVVATEDSELIMLRRTDFVRLLQRVPQIAAALLAELASRLRKTDRQIEGLALTDATSRISQTLQELADEYGVPTEAGVSIRNRLTHDDLASMSGTVRETVSRVLKRLERQGYLRSEGRTITILRDGEWGRVAAGDRPETRAAGVR